MAWRRNARVNSRNKVKHSVNDRFVSSITIVLCYNKNVNECRQVFRIKCGDLRCSRVRQLCATCRPT